jgi:ABC-type amino acid transport substrate-binding protein
MAAVLLSYWILPMIVAAVTPFRYKDIVGFTRDAMVTAFTTGNLFIVLTVLTENCKQLFEEYKLKKEKTDAYVDVIIPLSFNFPNTGKLLILLFILFAAWFSGNTLSLTQYPTFVFAGLLSFFGGVDIAIPFLLDLMRIPADLYQLYVVTTVLNGCFATLLAAMNLVVFTLMAAASLTGVMKINKKKVINFVLISVLLTVAVIGVTRGYFTFFIENVYDKDRVIANMQSQVFPIPRKVYESVTESLKPIDFNKPALQRIRESGVLRVGFNSERLPFTYFGASGELIGFDVDMAQLLARELDVKLEFIPFEFDLVAERLAAGHFDVIMSGIAITTPRLEEMTFSSPYMETNLSFVVPDYRRKNFATEKALKSIPDLTIGFPIETRYFTQKVKDYLPQAEIVVLDNLRDFFEANEHQLDGILIDAEGGSAWTLAYPSHNVVVPVPDIVKIPLAYPVAGRDLEFANFLSQWIRLKKDDGEFQRLYDHWVLGKDAVPKTPRWCIIRDVLGWV